MIQRIQSVYLIAIIALEGLLNAFSFFEFKTAENHYALYSYAVKSISGDTQAQEYKLLFASILGIVLAIIALLSFKNRGRQIKLTRGLLLLSITQISAIIFSIMGLGGADATLVNLGLSSFLLPVIAILCVLSTKAIRKDDQLVKSVDRIR